MCLIVVHLLLCCKLRALAINCSHLVFYSPDKSMIALISILNLVSILQEVTFKDSTEFYRHHVAAEVNASSGVKLPSRFPQPVNFSFSTVHVPVDTYVGGKCDNIHNKLALF